MLLARMSELRTLGCGEGLGTKPAFCENESLEESIRRVSSGRFQPLENVLVSFRAVTRGTRRNDVAWRRPSALHNGNHVIPRRGGTSAVGAPPLELLYEHFLSFSGDRIDSTPAAVGVLPTRHSKSATLSVQASCSLVGVWTAEPGMDLKCGPPVRAPTAPRPPCDPHLATLCLRRTGGLSGIVALLTDCFATISACRIDPESRPWFPFTTPVTPLLSRCEQSEIHRQRQAESSCSRLATSDPGTHSLRRLRQTR